MTLVQFLRIIAGRLTTILLIPFFPAFMVFVMTMNAPKEYTSSTLIFTGIASTSDAFGGAGERIDNYAVNNSFDNLLNLISSRELLERTGLKLLALHLVQNAPSHDVIGQDLFDQLQVLADTGFRERMTVGTDADSTFARLWQNRADPAVRAFTDNDQLPYSPEFIDGHLKTKRAGISDMVEMTYASHDAAATQTTLSILTGYFISEFRSLKSEDAQSLVRFFTQEAAGAEERLNAISAALKEYRVANDIINYDEQTKQLTVEEMYMNGELREELRKYAASEASLADLNEKLGNRAERIGNNQRIIELRDRLASVSGRLLTLQSVDEHSPAAEQLQLEVAELRRQLKSALATYSGLEHTAEGANIAILEQQWISQYIATVEGKVRINVFKERRNEFRGRFTKFAPLGSSLHKFERDIDVAEKEYLELLHSLNMARLRQQNLEASTTIKVLDAPILPLKAEPSKRGLLLIGAWIIGAFLAVVTVVALEMFDRNIRTPERAALFSRLPVLAAFPDTAAAATETDKNAVLLIRNQMLRNLKMGLLRSGNTTHPRTITVCSVLPGEGKSTVAQELAALLTAQGNDVTLLLPQGTDAEGTPAVPYTVPQNFSEVSQFRDLVKEKKKNSADFIIIEVPAFQQNEIPLKLLKSSSLILFVMRADRIWRSSDDVVTKFITMPDGPPVHAVINGVQLERIEEFVGELPKSRGRFRAAVKRLAEFRFLSGRRNG
ncbi:MAG: hypothetical protein KBF97_06235 [Bacteroidetes bacterium]|nr:hypothetical protein [Bacteroidota bacterium]